MRNIFLILLASGAILQLHAQSGQAPVPGTKSAAWEKLEPYFSPPEEFRGDFGKYRSLLSFYNGDTVKNARDWKRRRGEILRQWNKMMGEWPPFIRNQEIEILESVHRENFTQQKIRFKWLPDESTEGYLLIPDKPGKKPAVLTVFYEPETAIGVGGKPYRDFAYQLAKRGYVTLSIGTTEATQAKTYSLYYPSIEKARIEPLSALAYAAANAWYVLAGLPSVDPARIGVMGHSFGGKWAMFASCLFDKFACAVWSDPGIVFDETREAVNYWEPWYLGYYPKPWRKRGMITPENPAKGLYPTLVEKGYDLHELHALMAPRPFLVSGGSEDPPERWKALNRTVEVNRLLGYSDRVAMTNRKEHSPNAESNELAYLFFDYFLKGKGAGR